MAALWSEEAKYERWLNVELAFAGRGRAPAHPRRRPPRDRNRAAFDLARIAEIEAAWPRRHRVRDRRQREGRPPPATSTRPHLLRRRDTALSLALRAAADLILGELDKPSPRWRRSRRNTGRRRWWADHGVHAEPTTSASSCSSSTRNSSATGSGSPGARRFRSASSPAR